MGLADARPFVCSATNALADTAGTAGTGTGEASADRLSAEDSAGASPTSAAALMSVIEFNAGNPAPHFQQKRGSGRTACVPHFGQNMFIINVSEGHLGAVMS